MFFNSDKNRDDSPLARYWQEQQRGRADQTYVPDAMGRLGQGRWINQSEQADSMNFGGSPHNLDGSVGRNGTNARSDVAKVETLLGQSGHLDLGKTDGPTGYFGSRLEDAVKGYQKDGGLKVDGVLNPQGETMTALGDKSKTGQVKGQSASATKSPGVTEKKDGLSPPFIGPGGEGQRSEKPDRSDPIRDMERRLDGEGHDKNEIDKRVDLYRSLTKENSPPENTRQARLLEKGLNPEIALDIAKLGDAETNEMLELLKNIPKGAMAEFLTWVAGKFPRKPLPPPGPAGGGIR